jgi:hypothetical protein
VLESSGDTVGKDMSAKERVVLKDSTDTKDFSDQRKSCSWQRDSLVAMVNRFTGPLVIQDDTSMFGGDHRSSQISRLGDQTMS